MQKRQARPLGNKGLAPVMEWERPTLTRTIAEHLHSAVLTGKLQPGQMITEQGTAKSLGVSRSSVREAFQMLRTSGVLTQRNTRTFVNTMPTRDEIEGLYQIRGLCQALASEEAKKHWRKGDYIRLDAAIQQMEALARKGDIEGFQDADLAFHRLIWQVNQKTYLNVIREALNAPYYTFFNALLRRASSKQLCDLAMLHRRYLDILRKHEGTELKAAIIECYRAIGDKHIQMYGRRKSPTK
jgi:DNA-binding GntR family transcriptional regulator